MARLRGVLLDLDGVLYVGGEPLPGAMAAVNRLRDADLAIRFVTNTTRSPKRAVLEKLQTFGLSLEAGELFTPAMAARRMIETRGLDAHLLIHPAMAEDFEGLAKGNRPAVIVGDCGDAFTYAALNAAFRKLDNGAEFFALANNRVFKDSDGRPSLDAGPFVEALAFASGAEPVILGKPAAAFFREALASIGCAPHEAAMIGDDAESDASGAARAGMIGILVRTGKYKAGMEHAVTPPPSYVVSDLPDAVDRILSGEIPA